MLIKVATRSLHPGDLITNDGQPQLVIEVVPLADDYINISYVMLGVLFSETHVGRFPHHIIRTHR